MKNTESSKDTEEELFLDIDLHHGDTILPLHTSIVLFLMSYCDCKTFKTFLVVPEEGHKIPKEGFLPSNLVVSIISRKDLPGIVQSCRLPAVIEASGVFCRAGLAVVLRHIIQKTYSADPSRKDVLELLGFKKTCLKACAEVSQWTRLCEISIPWAVETFLKDPSATIPPEVLQLERKLGEPVRVHNDDKIRRQKMQEMKSNENGKRKEAQKETTQNNFQKPPSLELTAALSRLSVQDPPIKTAREPAHIRKAKTSDLPSLEHVFAEGLYFTLTDVVLLPCIHHFLDHGIEAAFAPHPCPSQAIDWGSLPAEVRPAEGKMSSDRALRKQQQLNNILSVVTNMAKPSDTIVDFCSGGGHVGIVLAYMLPSCQIILIENKEESLIRARDRSNGLGLTNIWFIQANLDYFTGEFNIGVALHACGVATDMVIEHCIAARAAFVICPCCYGFIQNTVKTTFPRSCRFQNVLSYKEHMVLCRFADQTAVQLPAERRQIGKNCMGLVDLDRAWAAEQHGYKAHVISMEPESCSPKNNLIVGCLN
ncbi:glutathione S-transferase C-terminal domain-containing protein isoform X2 [Hyla sarda]|uniref:glutathione S-transferase C-terminal domain-containing protein isoform X2 n=1 Tax=Hyla sarda TaxID=327740 RepID=UPI0024C2FAED|nr:glutathione S-transferase C-terminal domain-containing protein isoform X2 [Hyla sarda]